MHFRSFGEPKRTSCAFPLGSDGPGPRGPPWALVGQALVSLGPYGLGPWDLVGRAFVGQSAQLECIDSPIDFDPVSP